MSSSGDQGPLFTFALSQQGALPMSNPISRMMEQAKHREQEDGYGICLMSNGVCSCFIKNLKQSLTWGDQFRAYMTIIYIGCNVIFGWCGGKRSGRKPSQCWSMESIHGDITESNMIFENLVDIYPLLITVNHFSYWGDKKDYTELFWWGSLTLPEQF